MPKINPNKIIVIDEAGANLGMTSSYARSMGGERAYGPKPCNKGKNISIIGAINRIGIVAMMYLEHAVNADSFISFVEKLLLDKVKRGYYVILDNVRFHKDKKVRELIESKGAHVVFLPPYSPDLSPIEKMWSKIKEIMKRLMPRSKAEFHNALCAGLSEVTSEDCESWFEDCGY